jgi:hypothetical protein
VIAQEIGLEAAAATALEAARYASEELKRARAHPLAFFEAVERNVERFRRQMTDRSSRAENPETDNLTPTEMAASVVLTYAAAITMAASALALLASLPEAMGALSLKPHVLVRFDRPASDEELVEASAQAGRKPRPGEGV